MDETDCPLSSLRYHVTHKNIDNQKKHKEKKTITRVDKDIKKQTFIRYWLEDKMMQLLDKTI